MNGLPPTVRGSPPNTLRTYQTVHGGSRSARLMPPSWRAAPSRGTIRQAGTGKGMSGPTNSRSSSTIYSWVMNNHWLTNTPLTQDGSVAFRYRILLHGRYDAAAANRFGMEQFQPLVSVPADRNPIAQPILSVANPRVAVTILKSTGVGRDLIIRVRSLSDKDETFRLAWPAGRPRSLAVCERGEEPGNEVEGNAVVVPAMGYLTLSAKW